jgi:hypothetical protein
MSNEYQQLYEKRRSDRIKAENLWFQDFLWYECKFMFRHGLRTFHPFFSLVKINSWEILLIVARQCEQHVFDFSPVVWRFSLVNEKLFAIFINKLRIMPISWRSNKGKWNLMLRESSIVFGIDIFWIQTTSFKEFDNCWKILRHYL